VPLICQMIGTTVALLCSNSFTRQCNKLAVLQTALVTCKIVQAVLSQLASGRGAASLGAFATQPCLPADSDHALASLQREAER